jgi:hypothetical protein
MTELTRPNPVPCLTNKTAAGGGKLDRRKGQKLADLQLKGSAVTSQPARALGHTILQDWQRVRYYPAPYSIFRIVDF